MQEAVVDLEEIPVVEDTNEATVRCGSCGKVVPRTIMCLYCGSRISFKGRVEPTV